MVLHVGISRIELHRTVNQSPYSPGGSIVSECTLGKWSGIYYENMPIQIYWKFYHQKNENFQIKNSDIFHISAQNIDCGYSLEPPRRAEIRKRICTPVNPSFTI